MSGVVNGVLMPANQFSCLTAPIHHPIIIRRGWLGQGVDWGVEYTLTAGPCQLQHGVMGGWVKAF